MWEGNKRKGNILGLKLKAIYPVYVSHNKGQVLLSSIAKKVLFSWIK